MKKNGIIILLATVTTFFVSCKRDYNCTCSFKNNGNLTSKDSTISNVTKSDAIYYCDSRESYFADLVSKNKTKDTIITCNLQKK